MEIKRKLSKEEVEDVDWITDMIKQGKRLHLYCEPSEIMWETTDITYEADRDEFKLFFTDGCFDASTPSRSREFNPVYKNEIEFQTFLGNFLKYWALYFSAELWY
jgi:hypothetical protein